jgi:hypothetical protein
MSETTSRPDVEILALEPEPTAEWEPFPAKLIILESFGVRMWLGTNRREAAERMHEVLPPGWRENETELVEGNRFGLIGDRRGGMYRVDLSNVALAEKVPLDFALEILDSAIRQRVAFEAPDHIFVHAGVVAHEGRALLIPGKSFTGKTRLVAALVRAGATYYSDEFAPIDRDGRVHPYAKPLSIRGENQIQTNYDVASLGGTAGHEPLPVAAVVHTTFRAGAVWEPTRLSPAQGALALFGNAVAARDRPEEVLRAVTSAVDGAVILDGDRGEADELAPLLLAELEA